SARHAGAMTPGAGAGAGRPPSPPRERGPSGPARSAESRAGVSRAVDAPGGRAGRPRGPGSASPVDTRRMLRSSAVVGIGTALSRVTGFLRVAAIAYALGVSTLAGVYSYANETPNIVYELLLGGVLTATLVPLFVQHVENRDEDATSAVVTVAVLALVVITIVGELLAPLIVRLYTLDVSGHGIAQQRELATDFLRC